MVLISHLLSAPIPSQNGIVISVLKTMTDKTEIYSVGTAWLTDRSGTLRQTIAVDGFGARVLPNSSRAAKFKDIKAFFIKKLQATNPTTTLSPSPRISATAVGGKEGSEVTREQPNKSRWCLVALFFPFRTRHVRSPRRHGLVPWRACHHSCRTSCVGCGTYTAYCPKVQLTNHRGHDEIELTRASSASEPQNQNRKPQA